MRLDDLGVSRDLSARSQRIAAIPRSKFESYFRTAREARWEITWGGVKGLMFRSEADIFDLARQRRRSDSYYGADTDPVSADRSACLAGSRRPLPDSRGDNPATPVKPLVTLWHGDCLDIIPALPDASVDLLLTDPPYGSGELSWDEQPNLPALWTELRRIMKPNSRQSYR